MPIYNHDNTEPADHMNDTSLLEELPPAITLPITPPPLKKSLKEDSPDLLESILSSPTCLVEKPRMQLLPPPTTPLFQVLYVYILMYY